MAHDIVMAAAGATPAVTPEYVEDVFSTWLYTGNGSTQTITNGIALADGSIVSPENSTALPSVSNFRFNSVAFGNGLYVAIGEIITGGDRRTTSYATSPDGVTWTARSSLPNSIWQSIVFANGLFVAVSRFQSGWSDSIVATSTDGLTWNTSTSGFPTSYDARNISYANNIYFIVGSTISTGYRSTNGTTWTTFTTFGDGESGFSWDGIAFGNGRYVLIGGGGAFSSTNLSTWTSTNASVSTTHGIAFGNGVFVVVGGGGYSVSTDGVSFTNYTNITSASGSGGISFNGTNFVWATTGTQARVNVSTNATSWTAYQIAAPAGNLITTSRTNGAVVLSSSQNGRYVGTVSSFTPAVLGKGGMVWIKGRNSSGANNSNVVIDTARGRASVLRTNYTDNAYSSPENSDLVSFNSNGFTVGNVSNWNLISSSINYASWTFRRAPKFFDVVTYTGNGVDGRTISHNLGSTPGMVIVKRTDAASDWAVTHRNGNTLLLNTTNSTFDAATYVNGFVGFNLTSTTFSVNNGGTSLNNVNASGGTYVAYLFAHDAGGFGDAGTDNIISCGSWNQSTGSNVNINLGWEPQWLLIKRTDSTGNWWLVDTMRGFTVNNAETGAGVPSTTLSPNSTGGDAAENLYVSPTPTGFVANIGNPTSYIYVAIRRPMKKPTSGTEVFQPLAYSGNGTAGRSLTNSGFVPDFLLSKCRSFTYNWVAHDRLRGSNTIYPNLTNTEGATTLVSSFGQNNVVVGNGGSINESGQTYSGQMFRRAAGFFDVVCYTGTGSARTVAHNLGVAPELMIVKRRDAAAGWIIYHANLGNTDYVSFDTNPTQSASTVWNNTSPTSSVFTLGTANAVNSSGNTFVAYLFASLPGVSKVGSYTGNGSSQTINCGFSAGARFVLIKRTNSGGGSWYVFDTARGIVSGVDPYLLLEDTNAEVTGDAVDPANSGFIVNNDGNFPINVSGGEYIYLAIA